MGEKTEAQPPDGAENEENTRSGRRNKRPGASRDRPCRRRNVSGQRRAAPKKRPFSFGMSCSMRPAPREGRTRGAAPRQVRQRGRRAEAAFCHGGRRRKSTRDRVRPASRRKLQSTGHLDGRCRGRKAVGRCRKETAIGASSAPCAAHGCRRIYPTKPVRKDETKGTCRSTAGGRKRLPVGKGCVLSSAPSDSSIPVYRYTCQEGRGGFFE